MATPLTHLVKPTRLGDVEGTCIFCMCYTRHGFKIRELPRTFMDYDKCQLSTRNVICEYCYTFLKNENIRRRPWIIECGELRFTDRKTILRLMLEPPEPPYAIYVPKRGVKHGWILMMYRGVNLSREIVTVGFEDMLITSTRSEVEMYYRVIRKAVEKCGKTLLANPDIKTARRLGVELYREIVELRCRNRGLYELVLTLV